MGGKEEERFTTGGRQTRYQRIRRSTYDQSWKRRKKKRLFMALVLCLFLAQTTTTGQRLPTSTYNQVLGVFCMIYSLLFSVCMWDNFKLLLGIRLLFFGE